MKISVGRLLLGASLVLLVSAPTGSAVSLRVSPDLQQFFSDQSVNLSCEDPLDSDGLVVKKMTGGPSASCGADFGRLSPFCLLNEYKNFSGSYWCETSTGDGSDLINIIVSDKHLILQIPALPVETGSDVTLNCTGKNQRAVAAYFFFNGNLIGSDLRENLVLQNLQPSDEGSYRCSTDEFGSSLQSLLRVRGRPPPTAFRTTRGSSSCGPPVQISPPPPPPPHPVSSINFIPLVAAGAFLAPLALLVLVLGLGLWLWRKQSGRNHSSSSAAPDVTYAKVTFRKSANRIPSQWTSVRPHDDDKSFGFPQYCDPITS
ncbi:low affinity immunoglobulin gamma Fc region receptor II-a-like isoform X2 [Poecilia reticulata]|uniref:low affinity immunoglobulin gamma Fc region receptor II-a-like isoform X2 n=1 Tax=Poecilia reticulata TaxID=8081 RepID=UPI0004A2314C|nr:PREDICTED: low affinity immunoglobulin gamma Fc region receptor II-a-like isoform X2 [Poecilia reticulata]